MTSNAEDIVNPQIEEMRTVEESQFTRKHDINPLIERSRLPGETVRLPSCGIFYTNGELAEHVTDGEIHIYPMTALDEIVISSASKLFSGEGIIEVIQRCIPDIINPEQLLAQDIDYIMLCLRKISYGSIFEFKFTHEACTHFIELAKNSESDEPIDESLLLPRDNIYQIDMNSMIAKTKELSVNDITSTYRVELDNLMIIKMQPVRFDSYVKLMQLITTSSDKIKTDEERKNLILDQIASMILSVDEIVDSKLIRDWLEVITPQQVRTINEAVSNMASWGIDTSLKINCQDCGTEMEVDLPASPLALFS